MSKTQEAAERVREKIDADFEEHLDRIRSYLKIPSVSATGEGIEAGAEATAELVEAAGGTAEIVATDGHPAVVGVIDGDGPRLVRYGMYDVQPADEPVSMLDASVRGEILKLLIDLRDEMGLTLVMITHDLGVAWAVADRVAIMYFGKIVELGTVEQVLTNPLHPYTRALLTVSPRLGRVAERQVLTGEPPDPSRIPPGCRFHPRCPEVQSGRAGNQEPRCRGEIPQLRELEPGHFAACHLA